MSSPISELLILDCDGVIVDSEALSARVLNGHLAKVGVEIDFDYFCINFVGRSFPTVAQEIRDSFGVTLPDGFERDYRADLLAAFEHELTLTPNMSEILDRIDMPVCVATSSSPERVARSLAITGVTDRFRGVVFTASEVPNGKPAPDLFLYAAAKMGVPTQRCLVIEDSLPGLEAAHAAGMDCWRYTGGSHLRGRKLKHPEGTITFDSWGVFSEKLNRYRANRSMS